MAFLQVSCRLIPYSFINGFIGLVSQAVSPRFCLSRPSARGNMDKNMDRFSGLTTNETDPSL